MIDVFFTAVVISSERNNHVRTVASAQRGPATRSRSNLGSAAKLLLEVRHQLEGDRKLDQDSRSNSSSFVYHREGEGTNLMGKFNSVSETRSSAAATGASATRS
jgi:hypothetical protein